MEASSGGALARTQKARCTIGGAALGRPAGTPAAVRQRSRGDVMPLVTLTVRRPKTPAFKSAVLSAVHRALVASGVPQEDLFHRVLELSAEDFRFDPSYPDAGTPRTDDFVLIEILLSVGRSVKVKRKILADLVEGL